MNIGSEATAILLPQLASDGGNFRQWRAVLPDKIAIHTVCYPGRGKHIIAPPIDRMDQMVSHLISELNPALGAPYVILGSSMGAWIGYELALALEQRGVRSPEALIICAASAPGQIYALPPSVPASTEGMLDALEQFSSSFAEVRSYPELVELLMPAWRADLALCTSWGPSHYPIKRPIYCFSGTADPIASHASMYGWEKYSLSQFALSQVDGDHDFVRHPHQPIIDVIVHELSKTAGN